MFRTYSFLVLAVAACEPVADPEGDPPCVPYEGVVERSSDRAWPEGDVVVGLMPAALGEGLFELTEQVAFVATVDDDAFAFCLPAPVPDDGEVVATPYVLGAWIDADADGQVDAGEVRVGASTRMVLHLSGEPSGDAFAGAAAGWNTLDLTLSTEGPPSIVAAPIAAAGVRDASLPDNLLPVYRATLTATLLPDEDAALRADLVWLGEGDGPEEPLLAGAAFVADGPDASMSWEGPFDAPPPADHVVADTSGQDLPIRFAAYSAVAYEDLVADDRYVHGQDRLIASSTVGDARRLVYWVEATGFLGALVFEMLGLEAGWTLAAMGEGAPPGGVSWSDGLVLSDDFG